LEEGLVNGWKKILYGGWLEEILWMIGKRSGGRLEEDLVDDWKKIWWMIGRRSGGWF
jgi:hypothetical protein